MFTSLLDVLFGCSHERFSFPMTVRSPARRVQAAATTGTYVVCLDCGKEFGYDWKTMKMVKADRGAQPMAKVAERAPKAA
ncbi:MAG: hypothetical protein H0X25_16695 [Acidobacteriales bacterium]|nr:hypothetical protein [Terriglobales bacterium]